MIDVTERELSDDIAKFVEMDRLFLSPLETDEWWPFSNVIGCARK